MRIEKKLLPPSKWARPEIELPTVTGVVIHWVANPGANPKQIRDYFATVERYASAHYVIGINGEILYIVPENEVAYHAGPSDLTKGDVKESLGGLPNWRTIGIELCHPDWTGQFTAKTLEKAVSLTADICYRHSINVMKNVLRHYDCTGKHCPKWYVDHPDKWESFKRDVSIAMTPRNVRRL